MRKPKGGRKQSFEIDVKGRFLLTFRRDGVCKIRILPVDFTTRWFKAKQSRPRQNRASFASQTHGFHVLTHTRLGERRETGGETEGIRQRERERDRKDDEQTDEQWLMSMKQEVGLRGAGRASG